MKKHFSKIIFGTIVAVLATSGFIASSVHAFEQPRIFLQVTPAKQNIGKLNPGQTYQGSFKVQNVGKEGFNFKIYATPFKIINENYDKNFERADNYSQMTKWFTFSQTKGHLKPESEVEIHYTVKVPHNVPAGSQHMAIMAATNDGADKGNIKAISRVGMVLRTTINGKTRACAKILQNDLPFLYFNPPVQVTSRLENCGNIDLKAKYTITVTSLFGGKPVYSNAKQPITQDLYPESKYLSATTWPNAPRIGIFWVEHQIQVAKETNTIKKLVIIFPIWLLVVIALLILTLVFRFLMRRRARQN